jgi:hypothetical protein
MRDAVAQYERPLGAFSFACAAIWLLLPIRIVGEQTAWDLPARLRVTISDRGQCLPRRKQDMIELPEDGAVAKRGPSIDLPITSCTTPKHPMLTALPDGIGLPVAAHP